MGDPSAGLLGLGVRTVRQRASSSAPQSARDAVEKRRTPKTPVADDSSAIGRPPAGWRRTVLARTGCPTSLTQHSVETCHQTPGSRLVEVDIRGGVCGQDSVASSSSVVAWFSASSTCGRSAMSIGIERASAREILRAIQIAEPNIELCQIGQSEHLGTRRRIGEAGEPVGEQLAGKFVITAGVALACGVVDHPGEARRRLRLGLLFGVAEGGDAQPVAARIDNAESADRPMPLARPKDPGDAGRRELAESTAQPAGERRHTAHRRRGRPRWRCRRSSLGRSRRCRPGGSAGPPATTTP